MNKVSVIIPVYNVEKYIKKCIASVINQTLKEIEIIVVNDGTKDRSIDIVKEEVKNDKRVKIVEKENGGLSSARNKGLEYANGEYILFLDSDDYVELDMLEQTYNIAKKYNCDFVRYQYYRENSIENEKIHIEEPLLQGIYDRENIVKKILNPMIGVMPDQKNKDFINMAVWLNLYKNSTIKENKISFLSEREYLSEDIIFNIEFFRYSNKAYVLNKAYYHYIKNEKSLTASYKKDRFEKNITLYNYLLKILENNDFCSEYKLRVDRSFLNRIRECMRYELARDNIRFFEKYKNVKKIVNNGIVRNVIKIYPIRDMSLMYKIIFTLIKYRFCAVLCIIYALTRKL